MGLSSLIVYRAGKRTSGGLSPTLATTTTIKNQAGTIDGTQTVENGVLAGPITVPGTITVTGTLVIV